MPRIYFTVSDKELKQIRFAAKHTPFCKEPNPEGKFAYRASVNLATQTIHETVDRFNFAKK